jgi:hypothetical protein
MGTIIYHQINVYKWCELFRSGRTNVVDENRPGRPVEAATPATVQRANELVQENRRITLDEICAALDVIHGTAHTPVHDKLLYRKFCARWIPKQLRS